MGCGSIFAGGLIAGFLVAGMYVQKGRAAKGVDDGDYGVAGMGFACMEYSADEALFDFLGILPRGK